MRVAGDLRVSRAAGRGDRQGRHARRSELAGAQDGGRGRVGAAVGAAGRGPPADRPRPGRVATAGESRVARFDAPDVLVLGGGGILGEAWMLAVLAGLEDSVGFDARRCDGFVGTSAGSIVAASLVAGTEPRARLGELPEPPPVPASELAGQPYLR